MRISKMNYQKFLYENHSKNNAIKNKIRNNSNKEAQYQRII